VANSPQARKRARQNITHRLRSTAQRSELRTSIKAVIKALGGSDRQVAEAAYRTATSEIDSAVHKGLHHRNRAARLKSRLNKRLHQMEAEAQ